jgi:transposase
MEAMAMRRIEFKKRERTKEILRKEIRRSDEARYDHRLHAVLLAVDGRSPYDIAELLGDAPRSVYNWIKLFREDGLQGLREEMRPGRPMRLTERQIQSLAKDMVRSPEEFGYDQAIWDGASLGHHLEKTFDVTLGVRQCQRIFHHLGMRLLRPRTSPKGADADAQAAFKKN